MFDIEIIPGILEKEWNRIEAKINQVTSFAKTIHIDLMDGEMTEAHSFLDPSPFLKYTKNITFELHMMVNEPINYLKPWAEVGFTRFLAHIENMSDQALFVEEAAQFGEVGLAIDSKTPVSALTVPFIDLDEVLIMLNDAGASGRPAKHENFTKVTMLRYQTDSLFPLGVDVGINEETIVAAQSAGATRFITTSFLFSQGATAQVQYAKLHKALMS